MALRSAEEIQPRGKLPTNRGEDPPARRLRYRVELRYSDKSPRGRDRRQPIGYPAVGRWRRTVLIGWACRHGDIEQNLELFAKQVAPAFR